MRPDQHHLVLLTAAVNFGLTRCNCLGGGEAKLKGYATLGSSDVLPRSFGTEVDLVGWVTTKVITDLLVIHGDEVCCGKVQLVVLKVCPHLVCISGVCSVFDVLVRDSWVFRRCPRIENTVTF